MAARQPAPPALRTDRAFEPKAKAGTDDAASRSHLPGNGHDERGRYGKSVPDPECRESTTRTRS